MLTSTGNMATMARMITVTFPSESKYVVVIGCRPIRVILGHARRRYMEATSQSLSGDIRVD